MLLVRYFYFSECGEWFCNSVATCNVVYFTLTSFTSFITHYIERIISLSAHPAAAAFTETTMTCNGLLFKDCSPAFCINRQGLLNVNKSEPFFSFRRKSKFTKMAEHFEYNHIPAQLSSIQNFHVQSVICCQGQTVILHLVRNLMTQFGIIDLKASKMLGIFGNQRVEFVNEALRGEISPDGTLCLIKLPTLKVGAMGFVLQLYKLSTREMISEFELPFNHALFVWDPRSCASRVAVTSFITEEDNSLSLVRTPSWEIVTTNSRVHDFQASLNPLLKDLRFSRDGHLILAVMITPGCHCKEKKARRCQPVDVSVYVFDGDTAVTLHCVQYHRYACGQHSCLINYMPVFSECGSRMAIVLNDLETPIDHVQIYKLPIRGSLQNRCRIRILHSFPPETIKHLPLPRKLINYLRFYPDYL